MKVLCLIDVVVQPDDHWLWNYLPEHDDEVDFLWVTASDRFPKWGKLLTYYPSYLQLGLKAMVQLRKKRYDVVLCWEGKNGVPLALIRSLMGVHTPKLVILGYNQRGIIRYVPWLARFAMKSVDKVIVFSKWDEDDLACNLDLPRDKIRFCLHGWYDVSAHVDHIEYGDFIFTSGRSYRDYHTFAASLDGIDTRTIINARVFNTKGIVWPPNVVVNDLLPVPEFWALLSRCQFVVVPLQPIRHSGGDSVILQAMAAAKAVVATHAASPATYIRDGQTGLLVPPSDPRRLNAAMRYLLDNPAEAQRMGRNARRLFEEQHTFAALAERVHGIMHEVHQAA